MVMVLCVLLVLVTLVRPVDPNLGVKDLAAVKCGERLLGRAHVGVLDETIVESTVLEISVLNNFCADDGTSNSKNFREDVVGDPRRKVADVKMGSFGSFGGLTWGDAVLDEWSGHCDRVLFVYKTKIRKR